MNLTMSALGISTRYNCQLGFCLLFGMYEKKCKQVGDGIKFTSFSGFQQKEFCILEIYQPYLILYKYNLSFFYKKSMINN